LPVPKKKDLQSTANFGSTKDRLHTLDKEKDSKGEKFNMDMGGNFVVDQRLLSKTLNLP
jgi:hypothetical protein